MTAQNQSVDETKLVTSNSFGDLTERATLYQPAQAIILADDFPKNIIKRTRADFGGSGGR